MKIRLLVFAPRSLRLLAASCLFCLTSSARATAIYWDGGTGGWDTLASWSTSSSATTPDPAAVPTVGDTVTFNISTANAAETISLNADRSVDGIVFRSTATTALQGGGTNRALTVGAGGLAINASTGAVTIGSATAGQNVSIALGATQTWSNATTTFFTLNNAISGTNTDLNLSGGAYAFKGVIGIGTGIFTFSGSECDTANVANTMSGAVLKAGAIYTRGASFFGTTGNIQLGDTAANASGVNFRMTAMTMSRPIVLNSGTTGSIVIDSLGSGATPTLSGGISGTNNLTLQSNIGTGSGSLTASGAVGHTGSLSLVNTSGTGSGTGTVTVSGAIAATVTNLSVSKSGSSTGAQKAVLSNGANAYTGNTTVNSGTLQLGASNVIPDGTGKGNVTVNGTLDLNQYSEAINGLSGTGTVDKSSATNTSTLTVGGNNATASFSGIIKSTAGTVAFAKAGSGTQTLSGANTFAGGSSLKNGTVLIGVSNSGTTSGALGTGGVSMGDATTAAALLTNGAFTFSNAVTFGPSPSPCSVGGNTDNTSTFSGVITLAGNGIVSQVATTGANVLNITGGIKSGNTGTNTVTFTGPGAINVSGNPLANGATGALAVAVSGGAVTFSLANTYTGNTSVTGGSLTLTANNGISDTSTLEISTGAVLNLNFAGNEVVGKLTFDGITQIAGTWGAVGSGAQHEDARITGTGILLVDPVAFTWNSLGGDGLWSTAANWDVVSLPSTGDAVIFPAGMDTAITNDLPADTSLASLTFAAGAPAYGIAGSNNLILTSRIDNLSSSTTILGFPIQFGANIIIATNPGNLALTGNLTGTSGFFKTGAGLLELSGTNTYTGNTSISAGTLKIDSAASIPSAGTLAFTNSSGAATLDITGVAAVVGNMAFGTQTTGTNTVTVTGDSLSSLTTSPAALTFAPSSSATANVLTVNMSTLGAFTYNNSTGTISLQAGNTTSSSANITTVSLPAGTNTITAASLNVSPNSAGTGVKAVLNLGTSNIVHANNIGVANSSGRSGGTIQFQAGLSAGATLTIRDAAGTGASAITVGKNSSFGGDGTVYTSLFDTTGNGAVLDALVSSLTIGVANSDGATGRQANSNGTFKMGAGTLTASSATIGQISGTATTGSNVYTATGLLSLSAGGVANIGTVTLANDALATIGGTSNLNGQITLDGTAGATTLNATVIQQGTVVSGETSRVARINWNDGTIGNITSGGLAISGVSLVMGATGTHAFSISSGQTGTVSSVISGTGSLTKSGAGDITLSGANTYTGDTYVNEGTLALSSAFLSDASTVAIVTGGKVGLSFAGSDIVAGLVIDGVPMAGNGTTYGASGSGANVIDNAHFSGTGRIQVGISPDPYGPWIDSFTSLTNPADKTKSADPDQDGRSNLMEFALDGDPTSAANDGKIRSAVSNVSGDNVLTITLPVRLGASFTAGGDLVSDPVDGVIYNIQGTLDLADFTTTNVTEVVPALTSGMPILSSGWEYRTFRLPGTVSSNPRGFLRAVVAEP